jgi:hypothetical protein
MSVYYFALTFVFALAVIGWHRIKELFPISLISIIVVGIVNVMGINLSLFQYNKPFLDIFGIPLFHLLWAGIAGIVFINYMKPNFSHNLSILIYSTILVQGLAYISELSGKFQRLGSYNYYYNSVLDFSSLAIILLLSESLYKYRIYDKQLYK